jgi:hypothetical protein
MSSEALRAHLADRSALPDVQRALVLLDVRVQKSFFGTVEGVDTVHFALDALAYPLARLFSFPLDLAEPPKLVDVLAYLVSQDCIKLEVVALLERVRQGIRLSTYEGLRDEDIKEMEEARRDLYGLLTDLLSAVEQEAPHV